MQLGSREFKTVTLCDSNVSVPLIVTNFSFWKHEQNEFLKQKNTGYFHI